MANHTTTIAGSRLQYDLPTKCTCVRNLVEQTTSIEESANLYGVLPLTIKAWVRQYGDCYEQFEQLPAGTMRVAKKIIKGPKACMLAQAILKAQAKYRSNFEDKNGTTTYRPKPIDLDLILEFQKK